MNAGKLDEAEKVPMLHRLLQYRYSSTNQLMPDNDIISECMGHLYVASLLYARIPFINVYLRIRIAGSDTTSTSLSYFLWELSRRPDITKKLQAELDDVMHDPKAIPDISVLQDLPYLNAFIKEGAFICHSRSIFV